MRLKGLFADSSIFTKLILTAFFAVFGFLFCILLVQFAILLFAGVNVADNSVEMAENVNFMRLLQLAQSVGVFVVPSLIVPYLTSMENVWNSLHLKKYPSFKISVITIFVIIAFVPVINLLAEWNSALELPASFHKLENWMKENEEAAAKVTEQLLSVTTISGLLLNILLMCVVPAVSEELFFRGLLQNYFSQWTKSIHIGIWITAILFSAFHLQFYGFIPRMLLGAYFGYLVVWTGSLWLPVLAHFIHNLLSVSVYFLAKNNYITYDLDKAGTDNTIVLSVIGVIVVTTLVFYTRKLSGTKSKL